MEVALAQVREVADNLIDDVARNKFLLALRDTMYSLETQDDTLDRIEFLVGSFDCYAVSHAFHEMILSRGKAPSSCCRKDRYR